MRLAYSTLRHAHARSPANFPTRHAHTDNHALSLDPDGGGHSDDVHALLSAYFDEIDGRRLLPVQGAYSDETAGARSRTRSASTPSAARLRDGEPPEIREPQQRHGGHQARGGGKGGGREQHQPAGAEGHQEHYRRRPTAPPRRQQAHPARETFSCGRQEPAWGRLRWAPAGHQEICSCTGDPACQFPTELLFLVRIEEL